MEGHILSSIFTDNTLPDISFPALALLISGGHTELVLMNEWTEYTKIGQTRDDAAGEAFDKVARMLGLPYPGGPEISNLAKEAREKSLTTDIILPRPMMDSPNLDFSFSGLKTAVRYAIADKDLSHDEKAAVAREFEDAVTEVLLKKTKKAVDEHGIQTIIVGGGVSANTYIKEQFTETFRVSHPDITVYFPPQNLSTDNSIMIALAGHAHSDRMTDHKKFSTIKANGNLSLETE